MKAASEFQAWIGKAEEDWLCIKNELASDEKPWAVICYHAEQAEEKYLKAFLVSNDVRPDRTHDLVALLEACNNFDTTLDTLLTDCRDLTDYAIDSRYPGVPEDYAEHDARHAVEAAQRRTEAIRDRLPSSL